MLMIFWSMAMYRDNYQLPDITLARNHSTKLDLDTKHDHLTEFENVSK